MNLVLIDIFLNYFTKRLFFINENYKSISEDDRYPISISFFFYIDMRKFDGLGVIRQVNEMSVKIWHQFESNLFAIGTLIVCIVNIVSIFVDIFFVFQTNLHDGAIV